MTDDELIRLRDSQIADLLGIVEGLQLNLARQGQESLALARTNLWLNRQLEAIANWLGENDVDGLCPLPWQEELRAILQRQRPEHIGPPEMMHACFHWRDSRERPDGYFDVLPGDGFGFVDAVEGFGLRMHFDCAGIHACADLSFDALRMTLAKEGFALLRIKADALNLLDFAQANEATLIAAQQTRILELELDLSRTERELKFLQAKLYGEGEERDHVRIARDRIEEAGLSPAAEPGKGTEQ